ncbi:MAG: selenocysteine-specific translation elongation factor [Anaerolineaceae bacterium]
MRVIGTAGHVDHGKSTLVEALTGIHPDRLKEERAREMTIELGFAWLTLPDGEAVGIVDVPGHRDFIENMLSGVGGIDAAVFVVAADEGVMPQTREHLAILDILQVPAGIVAMTKIDLVDDPAWLDMVEADIRETLAGTILQDAPILRVSARTGAGLDDLKQALAELLAKCPPRPDFGRARLPVDRVFTMPGFGTVVTGTLMDGQFRIGDEVEVLPGGLKCRIRGLQSHRTKVDAAQPGSRTAINLAGVDVNQIERGDVICSPGKYSASHLLDVRFRLLRDVSAPLRHNSEVKFFIGAAEVIGRVRLLGDEEVQPGQEGWLQLELQSPVVAVRGDHYILRRPSPAETIGGGKVVDPHPEKRHKRFDPGVIRGLDALSDGTPAEILMEASAALGVAPLKEVINRTKLAEDAARAAVKDALAQGWLVPLEDTMQTGEALVVSAVQWRQLSDAMLAAVEGYHRMYPLRRGIPREELKSRLKISSRIFSVALKRWLNDGKLVEAGNGLARPDHQIKLTPVQQQQAAGVMKQFSANPYTPPSIKEVRETLGDEVYTALVELQELTPVSSEVVFRKADYDALVEDVRKWLAGGGTLTVAAFRDRYQTSRKYALAFLEHLDAVGITIREGDNRRLKG